MYNEKPKVPKKKIFEILGLIIFLCWIIMFLVDYLRYTESEHPLFALKIVSEYSDGKVTEYYGLGYTYRLYERNAISKEELVPFWKLRENPPAEEDLPQTYSGYNIPNNPLREDKYMGLIYYYDQGFNIGTYKCINTSASCNKATSGWDQYDIINNDYFTKRDPYKLEFAYKKYGWIDDSAEQNINYGETGYRRTIYLFDVEQNKILAKYSDIKDAGYDEIYDVGTGDDYKYIVREWNSTNWGIIHLKENGEIEEVLPFEYKSINIDYDTGYYMLNKDDKWYVYDLNKKEILSPEMDEPIFDVWINSNKTTYFKTGKHKIVGNDEYTEFEIYRIDGKKFTGDDTYVGVLATKTYVMLISKDNYIKFIDYSTEEKKRIPIKFHSFKEDQYTNPCIKITSFKEKNMIIQVYNSSELGSGSEEVFIDTIYWN